MAYPPLQFGGLVELVGLARYRDAEKTLPLRGKIYLGTATPFIYETEICIDEYLAYKSRGFAGTANVNNSAATAQIFGEVGYGVAVGQVALEPFAGLAFVHLNTDSFSETGGTGFGSGLLSGSDNSENIGYSTLGGRAATNFTLSDDKNLTLRASAAWMHAFDSVTPTAALTFQSTGASFTVAGVPLARDSALIEGGFEMHLNPQTKMGLSFSSQLGNNVQDNAVQGNQTWRF